MKSKVEIVFAKELKLIKSEDIKEFVIVFFEEICPDYFWTCPASTSGKYHPKISLGKGGLVRHTKLAVWWGIELLRALEQSPELSSVSVDTLQDEVIAALLMHDMIKNGKGINSKGFSVEGPKVTGTHGVTLAEKINELIDNDHTYSLIVQGIASHMGVWTTDESQRPHKIKDDPIAQAFAQLIHLADYCASRKVNDAVKNIG